MTITDIIASIYTKTKTNATSYPQADILIAINNAYDRVASLILSVDGRWQWDDSNNTDLPIATTALVINQQDYSIATSHLTITRVEIKDNASSTWRPLRPIDQNDTKQSLTQMASVSGTPIMYDKLANSVFLYPPPNYSQAASLKIYFQRGTSPFSSGDVSTGTKSPGFSSLYHDLIPLWVAYNYALDNVLPTANGYLGEITRKEEALKMDYSDKSKDEQKIIRSVRRNSR